MFNAEHLLILTNNFDKIFHVGNEINKKFLTIRNFDYVW